MVVGIGIIGSVDANHLRATGGTFLQVRFRKRMGTGNIAHEGYDELQVSSATSTRGERRVVPRWKGAGCEIRCASRVGGQIRQTAQRGRRGGRRVSQRGRGAQEWEIVGQVGGAATGYRCSAKLENMTLALAVWPARRGALELG
jgi:hypothetical protein